MAGVLPLLGVPHLDRTFDYRVSEELSEFARPGTRVRIRFAGRLVDGILLERGEHTEHQGELAWLERVISPDIVLPARSRELVEHVARHWMGVRSDVVRLALPPRHAGAEKSVPPAIELGTEPTLGPVELPPPWHDHPLLARFLEAGFAGGAPRAAWTCPPGQDWAVALAELADSVRRRGRQCLILVPDQRDLDRVVAECRARTGDKDLVADLAAGMGPSARYRRWLRAVRGHARIVVGTRSAVFTPLPEPGLIVMHDDGDDSYVEPRAPYPHTREVALARSRIEHCPLLLGSVDRTPEVAALVRRGVAPELRAEPGRFRARAARVEAVSDADPRQARDVAGGHTRVPTVAITMARQALDRDRPVLVQVPRRGYLETLLCASCRTPARCRRCNGPLRAGALDPAHGPVDLHCGWCGAPEQRYRCPACGSTALRAGVVGAGRTAEELGRMFPGVRVRRSHGGEMLERVPAERAVVVATPGAEPLADGGYGAALLLDAWALLGRQDLRAVQYALRAWIGAAGLVRPAHEGGGVFLSAAAGLPVAQALVRWDPQGWADRELDDRTEVGFPPAVHLIALDGPAQDLVRVTEELTAGQALGGIPDGVELLGPVELPAGEHLPGQDAVTEPERLLLRVPPAELTATAAVVRALQVARSSRRGTAALRVRLDPVHIG